PGEYQFLVGNDLAVDAADIVGFARGSAHLDAIAAADPRVGGDALRHDLARPHPALYFFRVGPRREDLGGGRFEAPADCEAWVGGGGFEAPLDCEAWLDGGGDGHDSSSSRKSDKRDRASDQNRS